MDPQELNEDGLGICNLLQTQHGRFDAIEAKLEQILKRPVEEFVEFIGFMGFIGFT